MKTQHTLQDGTILKVGQKYILGSIINYNWVKITCILKGYFKAIDSRNKEAIYSLGSNWLYYFDPNESEVNDRLDYSVQDHKRQLKAATKELNNTNLTPGESRMLHVEIEKLNFSLLILNFIQND